VATEPDPYPWLVLLHAQDLSHTQMLQLLEHTGSAAAAIGTDIAHLQAFGLSEAAVMSIKKPHVALLHQDQKWLAQQRHHLVVWESPEYPPLLAKISDPPLMLFVAGDPEVLCHPQVAIVGSRNPSAQGRENAGAFAEYLCRCGFAITSGLARGIDAAAHIGAIEAGGFSIAVCGTGLGSVYPKNHVALAGQLSKRGAVVSEFPFATPPYKANFPRRNRIISGLAVGTVVIEAAHRSGSLITARLAGEQGREIFALPGSIHNPMARGCHRLIRDGARLVECGEDIIEELGNLTRTTLPPTPTDPAGSALIERNLDANFDMLLNSMGHDPSSVDQLCARTGLTADQVSAMLLLLELRGYVKAADGGRYLNSNYKEKK